MSNNISLQLFAQEIVDMVNENMSENHDGLTIVGNEYWQGRFFESIELDKKIKRIIKKYNINIIGIEDF